MEGLRDSLRSREEQIFDLERSLDAQKRKFTTTTHELEVPIRFSFSLFAFLSRNSGSLH
jgi:hypothetical protein